MRVYCDQTTAGGGWAVFQRRRDGSVDFYRGWSTYKHGFGHVMGEFWLGLDKINLLTHQTRNKLRVDMMDWHGNTKFAEYSYFSVAAERSKYVLGLGRYSGTAGDSLSYHRGSPFSTKGRDNDAYGRNCAADYKGAWWFKSCYNSHLNGEYRTSGDAVAWNAFSISLKRSEMKIRPTDFIPK
ncbi:predicted protein [Nematostella vectensis]|uniref:Fibrinogen C-terminal domain-containing protein n=1 Tax=Nematostella vectensis TaxID=45351 RepID=A7SLD8_NEMVE|nr:predicted protein [Nematostella vectensis]|eukprot:XP_001627574.1 predicted protein [Nematostella vectensis]